MEKKKTYICIDLKSFYASVECVERGLDPLTTNLVVADKSRTNKTICLAVSPGLKSFGVPGRPRLFEVEQQVSKLNRERLRKNGYRDFSAKSYSTTELGSDPSLELDYIVAEPRMNYYMQYSGDIYKTYLNYISSEDIHVYSIDEVFMDVTAYLNTYGLTAHQLAMKMIRDVLGKTGITATAGIGPNMYLAKVAMDIVAKHIPADKDGVRIAEVDEYSYRELLWDHLPLTDFWMIGGGYLRRLDKYGLKTMGDVARFSLNHADKLFREFGVNAELLIDHAWGYETCEIKDIKSYVPSNNSVSSGQVLFEPYPYDRALIIVKEMMDALSLDLVEKGLVTSSVTVALNYDVVNVTENYEGDVVIDYYGRKVPKSVHGSVTFPEYTASTTLMVEAGKAIFERIADPQLYIRRVTVIANEVKREDSVRERNFREFDLFSDPEEEMAKEEAMQKYLEKEKNLQKTMLNIKRKYGRNAVVKGMNLEKGATGLQRNKQVGGHKS